MLPKNKYSTKHSATKDGSKKRNAADQPDDTPPPRRPKVEPEDDAKDHGINPEEVQSADSSSSVSSQSTINKYIASDQPDGDIVPPILQASSKNVERDHEINPEVFQSVDNNSSFDSWSIYGRPVENPASVAITPMMTMDEGVAFLQQTNLMLPDYLDLFLSVDSAVVANAM
ncbi:hypothetical protein K470DRAFT_275319 [Piedraia hortae CBS 480.64]|uniref:Uncharacterized protein n=1 Tax=Piedraia hortae CBS 480.64 TaxID=1314780 RepID=A0A6A7C4V2_9PEZI|nr:hypothetical protein K470DRAFT_275319 [Piedraia hortae CBS 480.64]